MLEKIWQAVGSMPSIPQTSRQMGTSMMVIRQETKRCFYDFAVLGYDMAFSYKGKRYYFLSDPEYVALTDESFTKEYERFDNGNAALEQFLIDGKPIVKLVSLLENVEPF